MRHEHHHHEASGKNLFITILLNLTITIAQIVGGIISGSMALLSDAAHNFSDVLSLIISYVAKRLALKERCENYTFGYKRAEIFAAFINSATLFGIAVFLMIEAVQHLINPQAINGTIVIYLAALSILINGLSVLLIKKEAKESMNMKSAYLHLFTDMLTSIAVLIGGFVVKYLNWGWFDGVLSLGIAIYLIYSSWGIFKDSVQIFMQFTPQNIDLHEIVDKIEAIEQVKNVHHVHIWQLDEHEIMFEAHIDTREDISIRSFEQILEKADEILEALGIHHSNIQPEYERKDNKKLINN